MTAAEIAKIVGVSRSTVTRIINNYPYMAEETRKKVLAAVQQYGYVPNASARSLAGKKSKNIGLFIYADYDISSSAYYGGLITHVIDCAENLGYCILTSIIKPGQYGKIARVLGNGTVQGAIITGGALEDKETRELMQSRHNILLVDQVSYDSELAHNCGLVNRDNFNGAYLATEYLLRRGHRKIMHISGKLSRISALERLKGYKKALQDYGVTFNKQLVLSGDFDDITAECLVTNYLKNRQPPTAIFAANDMMAIGAIRALKAKGYHVPQDVSVVGFDDIYVAKEIDPKLTTINSSPRTVAIEAVEKLIKMIETKEFKVSKSVIGVALVIRDSVRDM